MTPVRELKVGCFRTVVLLIVNVVVSQAWRVNELQKEANQRWCLKFASDTRVCRSGRLPKEVGDGPFPTRLRSYSGERLVTFGIDLDKTPYEI